MPHIDKLLLLATASVQYQEFISSKCFPCLSKILQSCKSIIQDLKRYGEYLIISLQLTRMYEKNVL